MSKRTLEEYTAVDVPARKKSRKEKSKDAAAKNTTESPAPESIVAKAKKEKKDKKDKIDKKRSKEQVEEFDATSDAVATNGALKTPKEISKAERKAAKKAKKLALASEKASGETDGTSSEPMGEESARAGKKAAKKAEKARLKALKKAEKASASGTATPEVTVSATSSTLPSSAQSSITAPESEPATPNYVEHSALAALPQSEIDSYLSTHLITISDPLNQSLRPLTSFEYLPITDEAQRAPFASFTSPTPIQAAAWPSLFAGRDVVGVAETGSGKTLAFGVPCIRYITSFPKKERRGVKAVIVSPTRELACQIHEQLVKLATPAGLHVVCVYGGVSKDDQRFALKKASIVVATPGRLNDLIGEGAADLSKAGYVVLDEGDRMLDKGFEEEIKKIINTTPATPNRQTLMFTATWPPSVRELASTFMTSPVRINIGDNPTGELRANTRIEQKVEVVDPRGKEFRLLQLLKEHQAGKKKDDRILVFCLYKKEATRIENFICSKGFKVAGIHGDLSQAQRTASLDAFKQGKVPLLVATDVAARGLDIPAVKVVINVTFPLTAEDYVHRIGRTGRAGQDGKAITLFTEHDKGLSGALINVLRAAKQPIPEDLLKFGTTVKKKEHGAYGAFYKETDGTKKATKITFD